MKILHTSDWHLGRVLHGHSLLDDQQQALDRLFERMTAEGVRVLLVAGDVYDRAVPPVEAVQMCSRFLVRLADAGISAVIIAGNHDSATRLGFAGSLLERAGIYICSDYGRAVQPITLVEEGVEVDIFAVPFIEAPLVAEAFEDDSIKTTQQAATAVFERIRGARREKVPSIVVAHEFVGADAETSDSERVFIGGAHVLETGLFEGFDYVALGHLHRPQAVQASGRIRYSGSLLPYSFSEARDTKGAMIIDISQEATLTTTPIPMPPPRPLAVLEDSLDHLLQSPDYAAHAHDYVSARLTDAGFHLNLQQSLRARFPHLLEIRQLPLEALAAEQAANPKTAVDTPVEVFELFLNLFGWEGETREAAREIFRDVAETIRRAESEVER